MTSYMYQAGLLGKLLRERVDPALTVIIFEIGFHSRQFLVRQFPDTRRVARDFAVYDYMKGGSDVKPKDTSVSPMRFWTIHPMLLLDVEFIAATLFPTFVSFVSIVMYMLIHKAYFRVYPLAKVVWPRATEQSSEADALLRSSTALASRPTTW